jgi:hypothetical protein
MSVDALIQVLEHVPEGELTGDARHRVIRLLAECWQDFRGANETAMEAWKLGRAEELRWKSPFVSFTIERHGATVLGSSRAELQTWKLNLETRNAQCARKTFRQLRPASPRLDVKLIATRVCEIIREGSASNSDLVENGVVVWKSDDEVWIYHGKLIPGTGYSQTVAGRRKRFRDELTSMMKSLGWKLREIRRAMIFTKPA